MHICSSWANAYFWVFFLLLFSHLHIMWNFNELLLMLIFCFFLFVFFLCSWKFEKFPWCCLHFFNEPHISYRRTEWCASKTWSHLVNAHFTLSAIHSSLRVRLIERNAWYSLLISNGTPFGNLWPVIKWGILLFSQDWKIVGAFALWAWNRIYCPFERFAAVFIGRKNYGKCERLCVCVYVWVCCVQCAYVEMCMHLAIQH